MSHRKLVDAKDIYCKFTVTVYRGVYNSTFMAPQIEWEPWMMADPSWYYLNDRCPICGSRLQGSNDGALERCKKCTLAREELGL